MNYDCPVIRDNDVGTSSLTQHMEDPDPIEAYQNEPGTCLFINSFKSLNG